MYGIGNRWREVEKAAVRIINGLTENDFATVMAFDTQVESATGAGNAVIRMDATGRQTLIDWLDDISAGTSGANYNAALQSAFDALFGQPADCPRSLLAFVGMELITSSRIS